MGASAPENNSPPPQALQENPGFSFVVPTEFVELPSGGKYYPEGHPLRGQGTIEIKQMTAKEEDILTSRTLLKSGVAIDRVIQSIVMDKTINTDTLLVGDRNAILIAARVSGYGNIYNTNVTCPNCSTAQDYSFDLNNAYLENGGGTGFEVTNNGDGSFTTVLPRTNVTTTFRLLTGHDEKNMLQQAEMTKKRKGLEQAVSSQIRRMIVDLNGDSSQQALNYFIENVPSLDIRHLRACYRSVAPNIDLTQDFECQECGHEQEMEVPLTADFFWPDR